MTSVRKTLIALSVTVVSMGALAQKSDEHKDHHPAGTNPPAATAPARPASAPGMASMDQHRKAMQAMHEKMMTAKTPEARQALMAEHMKLMQDSMAMMKGMGGQGMMGGMGNAQSMGANISERQQMMEKRMDMMESMMQMMMDRMPANPGK